MRKILTTCLLFLTLTCSAAAQSLRDWSLSQNGKSKSCLTKELNIPHPFFQTPDTVNIVIMGDMMMHRGQIANARVGEDSFDFSECFQKIEHLIKGADIAVANMEFTLAGKPYTGYPCFSAPDSYAEAVAESGVDIFLTANNHILDKGTKGILLRDRRGSSADT